MTTADRLNVMPLGEAMFTQRAIRRFRTDPIPADVMQDIMQAAIRAPNGGNNQQWHFIVVQDEEMRRQLGDLYHEAWWAKRADAGIMGPEDIPPGRNSMRSAMRLANEIGDAPVMVLVCATAKGPQAAGSVIPAAQNMLLAARAFGIGGTIATLHPVVEERVHALFSIPDDAQVVYCMPFGYPRGNFGPVTRLPLNEVCSYDRWCAPPD
ncbi:MAG: nitroreductase family protein [Dehalococcoidia bacterium]|nr:nitroreductase family protein [Dehalococcoidia bacterium]